MEKKYRHSGAFSGHNNKMLNVAEIASEEQCPALKYPGIISNVRYGVRYKRKQTSMGTSGFHSIHIHTCSKKGFWHTSFFGLCSSL